MADPTPTTTPPAAGATSAPAAKQPPKKAAKDMKPSERIGMLLMSDQVTALLKQRSDNPDQAREDVAQMLDGYFRGHEDDVIKYIDAATKLEEAKLAADAEPSKSQKKAIDRAQKEADKALKRLEKIMKKNPESSKDEQTFASEVKLVSEVVQTGVAPEAAALHEEKLAKIKKEIAEDKAKGWFRNTTADLIVQLAKESDPKKKEALVGELAQKIQKKYDDLSDRDAKAMAEGFAANATTQAAEIEKENVVYNMAEKAKNDAVDTAKNLPSTLLKEGLVTATTGLPPGTATVASNSAAALARRRNVRN